MKILELEIECYNLSDMRRFYTETLGFELLHEEAHAVKLQVGFTRLTLRQSQQREGGPYHFAFAIPRDAIAAAVEWLKGKAAFLYGPGGTTPIVQHELWQAQAVYFFDTDFNILELIAHEKAPVATAPFSAAQVLGVGEVGLAVPDVTAFTNELMQRLYLSRWKEAMDGFEAVGTEEGMFVVVQVLRAWFPTQLEAVMRPMRVRVDVPGDATIAFGHYQILQRDANEAAST